MLKLTATFKQQFDGTWDGEIDGSPHIFVTKCEDLQTAQVVLKIITAEEVEGFTKGNNRKKWDIVAEHIYTYRYFQQEQ